jgi:long-subunit fatty acid transport protein
LGRRGGRAGTTDGHVGAIVFNPAALGSLEGTHLYFGGSARWHVGQVGLAPVDGLAPGVERGAVGINFADFDGVVGLAWHKGPFTLAAGAYTPAVDLTRFGNSPLRYHAKELTHVLLTETAGFSFRVTPRIFVGAAVNFTQAWLRYDFSRDVAPWAGSAAIEQPGLCGAAPCGLENPAAEQNVRLAGFGWGVGLSVGLAIRPIDRLWLGASYISQPISITAGPEFTLLDQRLGRVRPALVEGAPCADPRNPSAPECTANSSFSTFIPDILYFGARGEVSARVELAGSVRWVHYGGRTRYDVTVQGRELEPLQSATPPFPPQLALDRGFRDAVAVDLQVRVKVGDKLRLAPGLVFETSSMDRRLINAAAIDAEKLDASLIFEWRVSKRVRLGGHLGATALLLAEGGEHFDPRAPARCADAAYDLGACGEVVVGRGLPSAAGRYSKAILHGGLSLGVDFQ